jgi:hypothetical protein
VRYPSTISPAIHHTAIITQMATPFDFIPTSFSHSVRMYLL